MWGEPVNAKDTAGVIAPPPLIYLAAVVLGLIFSFLAPTPFLPRGLAFVLGSVLIVIAVWLSAWGVRVMRRADTSEKTYLPTTALVTTGLFRFSRNPLYVSLILLRRHRDCCSIDLGACAAACGARCGPARGD
jgi:protein-S-isoprenylcysteine O-methyltransferase Ste14